MNEWIMRLTQKQETLLILIHGTGGTCELKECNKQENTCTSHQIT